MPTEFPRLIAQEVSRAFDSLGKHNGALISDFHRVFAERSRLVELSEGDGGVPGLTRLLTGLLRRSPSETYLVREYPSGAYDKSFGNDFHVAVKRVAEEHPDTLYLLKKHADQSDRKLSDILKAIFARYVANAEAYPF